MRNYKKYMDGVEVSPELHERLSHLTPAKGPAPWKKYGALAAALVLVVGAGALGLSRLGATDAGPAAEIAEEEPDIAPVTDPAQLPSQQLQTNGGYEVTEGEVVSYFMLPAIVYNDAKDMTMADYSLAPPGSLSRTAGRSDVSALLDGADMTAHLLWDDELAWSGTVWLREEDSSPCAASLYAEGESVMFFVELMEGSAVPSCVVYPDACYKTTTFQGVEITALRSPGYAVKENGRELKESRELSLMANGMGCKLTIYGTDGEQVEEMCARFARWAIVEGFDLSALSSDGAQVIDSGGESGEPNDKGGADTPAYDPGIYQN